jgi:pSer/pThr/pTyr-binding forkhead associated (FHA) protein
VRCPHCGHGNEPDAHFCAACGTPFGRDDETQSLAGLSDLVEILESDDDLAQVLVGLPEGQGMLIVRGGPNAGSRYWLEDPVTTLGRHPKSDIFLDDRTVSRDHAVIRHSAAGYDVTDVGSLNGTYLDQQRVDTAPLHHLAELQIGRFVLVFVLGGHTA